MGLFHRKKKQPAPPAPPPRPKQPKQPAKLSDEAARELARQLSSYMKQRD